MAFLRMISNSRLGAMIAAVAVGGGVATAMTGPVSPWHRTANDSSTCGTVVVAGDTWLAGTGVDVHSNGDLRGSGTSCAHNDTEVYDLSADPPIFGFGWQCVELVNRLYATKGWYPRLTLGPETNYGAKWLFTYAETGKYPGLTAHPNGSGYTPVPGDMIVHSNGDYGHVAVVDAIDGDVLRAVEQNRSPGGRSEYRYDAGTGAITQDGATVSGYIHATKNEPAPANEPAADTSSAPVPEREKLTFAVIGNCTTDGGTLRSTSSGFAIGGAYRVTATYPNGKPYPGLISGTGRQDGSVGWTWPCHGDPPGEYTTTLIDVDTGRSTGPIAFRIGAAKPVEPAQASASPADQEPVPGDAEPPQSTPSSVVDRPSPSRAPLQRTITIFNKVTDGGSDMREDTPAYFSTTTRNFCKPDGCAVADTDMSSGDTTTAICQTRGDRTTNGEDGNLRDDQNPGLYTSDLWYHVTDGNGRGGYISSVWITPEGRGGLGLPTC